MKIVQTAYQTAKKGIEKAYDETGKFLDKNPELYKTVLVVSHFFRAAAMFGIMMWLPTPLPVTASILAGGTLLYRAAIERFCCFRFAIPSMVGAGALWLAKASIISFVSGVALSSFGMILASSLGFLPLLGYTGWIIYLSISDIDKRMQETKFKTKLNCCCN